MNDGGVGGNESIRFHTLDSAELFRDDCGGSDDITLQLVPSEATELLGVLTTCGGGSVAATDGKLDSVGVGVGVMRGAVPLISVPGVPA